jgi:superfamily I DNA/RNA helicase
MMLGRGQAFPPGCGGSSQRRLATMHRVKGLEFPRVLLAGVQELQRSRDLTHLCSREMVHPFGASGLPA